MQRKGRITQSRRRRHLRGERALVERCRRGDADGLDALAYRLAPLLWREAWASLQDAVAAREVAIEAFEVALSGLRGWCDPTLAGLEARALVVVKRRAGRTARARARMPAGGGGRGEAALAEVAVPEDLVETLRARARAVAPELEEAAARRGFWRLQAYAVLLALVAGVVMILVNYGSSQRWQPVPPAVVEGVQFRVRHTGLSSTLQDVAWELAAPDGPDKEVVSVLEEAALALDEVANVPEREGLEQFKYLAWRVRRQNLAERLQEVAPRTGRSQAQVEDAALVIEEVSNWFGG